LSAFGTALAEVPVPSVLGPIAVSASSYPFARVRNVDLESAGFVEEEYFVSGKANVYQWNENGTAAEVRSAAAPYTTRILVLKPRDPKRFNGRVMVDIMNMTNGWDFNKMWAVMHHHLLEDGWAYVGISSKPVTIKALKTFDPERYAPLSWANPLPLSDARNCEQVAADSSRDTENGLAWDIFSQVGALLKSRASSNPLRGLHVERLYLTGYSQSSNYLLTYINAVHPSARLARGRPVWDGFLLAGGPVGSGGSPINQCEAAALFGTRQLTLRAADVPVINVVGAMDVIGMITTIDTRRDDNDAPNDRFRLYEVPGGSHSWLQQLPFTATDNDVHKAGYGNTADRVPVACTKEQPNNFPMHYVLNAALDNLDRWASAGAAPPRSPRLETEMVDGKPRFVFDADGNLKGGYRLPAIDVPLGNYLPANNRHLEGAGCWSWGHFVPYSANKLKSLYPTQSAYVTEVAERADAMRRGRMLTASDARRIVETAANSPLQ
jgi:hypothetical protein